MEVVGKIYYSISEKEEGVEGILFDGKIKPIIG